MVVLFDTHLSIQQLFESGIHWRGPPFIRTLHGLDPRNLSIVLVFANYIRFSHKTLNLFNLYRELFITAAKRDEKVVNYCCQFYVHVIVNSLCIGF